MKYRIKISEKDFEAMSAAAFSSHPKEAGGFALAGFSKNRDTYDVLIRRVVAVPSKDFTHQREYSLEISPKAINGLIALCESANLGAVLFHSHPETISYSATDDFGEKRVFETLRQFIATQLPTASILLYPDGIEARIWLPGKEEPEPIEELIIIGDVVRHIRLSSATGHANALDPTYSRQVLAFGEAGQRLIQLSRVAIVGLGGTGSACAEQLVRLGVADFILIDFDKFEESNLSRVYGSYRSDVAAPPYKADLAKRNIQGINPNAKVSSSRSHVAESETAMKLKDADYIFLCTDDHWGRAIVNQIAYQYFIPTINMGVRLDARNGAISGAAGNVDVLRPDLPCLWCKGTISSERIGVESTPKERRSELLRDGYIEDVETKAPSVVSLNTVLAGLSVTEFIRMITGFTDAAISRLNYYPMEGIVSSGHSEVKMECVCKKQRARGDIEPLPTVEKRLISERSV